MYCGYILKQNYILFCLIKGISTAVAHKTPIILYIKHAQNILF